MVCAAIWESEIRYFQGYPCTITEYLEARAQEGISVFQQVVSFSSCLSIEKSWNPALALMCDRCFDS